MAFSHCASGNGTDNPQLARTALAGGIFNSACMTW